LKKGLPLQPLKEEKVHWFCCKKGLGNKIQKLFKKRLHGKKECLLLHPL